MANLDALFSEYRHPLFRYFCRAVGRTDLAHDLTQDVFVRISGSTVPSGPDGVIRAWIFRIARNLAVDYHRGKARRSEAALGLEQSRPAHQDVELAVNEALATLPDLDRDVFLMREVSGLGYEDIARVCELTPDAVRSRIHRARMQLRHFDLVSPPPACCSPPALDMWWAPSGWNPRRLDRQRLRK